MVMNKKGFLKILEAIIAIVVVLSFVVAIFPEKPKDLGKLPPALQETMDSVLKEIRENAKFRDCVLGKTITVDFGTDYTSNGNGAECVYKYIEYVTAPAELHPWGYAVSVCKTLEGGAVTSPPDCKYNLNNLPVTNDNKEQRTTNFRNQLNSLTEGQNVYIRSATISVSDASEVSVTIEGGEQFKEKIKDVHLITLYAWAKE